jgi:hypothetical protein
MTYRIVISGVAAIAAATISACGGGGDGSAAAPPPPSTAQSLDTTQVLTQAREPSETSVPYPLNDGALVLTDTSDSTDPININGT